MFLFRCQHAAFHVSGSFPGKLTEIAFAASVFA